jgi:hypothetical protein
MFCQSNKRCGVSSPAKATVNLAKLFGGLQRSNSLPIEEHSASQTLQTVDIRPLADSEGCGAAQQLHLAPTILLSDLQLQTLTVAVDKVLLLSCNQATAETCSRRKRLMLQLSGCLVETPFSPSAAFPSFGPTLRLLGSASRSVEVLGSLRPARLDRLSATNWFEPEIDSIVVAQSIVARPIDAAAHNSLTASLPSNTAQWYGRIVVAESSDTVSPAQQVKTIAAYGASAVVLINTHPACRLHHGCWEHDLPRVSSIAKQQGLPVIVIDRQAGRRLLRYTNSDWMIAG